MLVVVAVVVAVVCLCHRRPASSLREGGARAAHGAPAPAQERLNGLRAARWGMPRRARARVKRVAQKKRPPEKKSEKKKKKPLRLFYKIDLSVVRQVLLMMFFARTRVRGVAGGKGVCVWVRGGWCVSCVCVHRACAARQDKNSPLCQNRASAQRHPTPPPHNCPSRLCPIYLLKNSINQPHTTHAATRARSPRCS